VASHEIDEALGTGSGIGTVTTRAEDLFRYSANGVRSYTNSSSGNALLLYRWRRDNLVNFNQNGSGDYGDWASSGIARVRTPSAPPARLRTRVELTALDVTVTTSSDPRAFVTGDGQHWYADRVHLAWKQRKQKTRSEP